MESLFNTEGYRSFIKAKLKTFPKRGYGYIGKLATHINVHPSLVSQILSGEKSLTLDQALAVVDFFGLADLEADYFLLLVQLERAGTPKLKEYLRTKLTEIAKQASQLVHRVRAEKYLSEQSKAIFYSDWTYTAVRQLTTIKGNQTPEAIARTLELPVKDVQSVLEFLTDHGLCVFKNGKYGIGPQSTHLSQKSPWAKIQHRNWRQKAMEQLHQRDPDAFFFTCPLTLGAKDIARVRELMIKFVEELYKIVDSAPSEEFCCLNMDWFKPLQ